MSTPSNRPHGSRALVAVVVLVPLLAGLALAAFAWPAARLAPRDLPIGVVAPAAAGEAIEQRLARDGDAVEVLRFADQASARTAIADRDVYGAIVVAPDGTTVLTASAASPLVAQLLQQAASALPAGAGSGTATPPAAGAVRVVDAVPADPDDPRGAALAASVLPLVLAGMAAGVLVWLAGGAWPVRWAVLVVASGAAGLVAAGIAQGWLGVLEGDWLVNAGVLGLTVLAVWVVVGLLVTWVAAVRRPRPSPAVAPEADPVPVP
jgi:hypothetical protein